MFSSDFVQVKRIFLPSRLTDMSMSSIASSQMWSVCERSVTKKPSLRNSSTSLVATRSATSRVSSSKTTSRPPSRLAFGCLTPRLLGKNSATSAGGAMTVVTSVMRMPMPKTSCVRYPCERPMPAMMSATSPRGIIPAPTLSEPRTLKPQKSEGIAQPSTFARTANAV